MLQFSSFNSYVSEVMKAITTFKNNYFYAFRMLKRSAVAKHAFRHHIIQVHKLRFKMASNV